MTASDDCLYCTAWTGGYDDLPPTWTSLDGKAGFREAPWVKSGHKGPFAACKVCGQLWYLNYIARENYYHPVERVPDGAAWALSRDGKLVHIIRALKQEGEGVECALKLWFGHARYSRHSAIQAILQVLSERSTSPHLALQLLAYLGEIDANTGPGDGDEPARPFKKITALTHYRKQLWWRRADSSQREWMICRLSKLAPRLLNELSRLGVPSGDLEAFKAPLGQPVKLAKHSAQDDEQRYQEWIAAAQKALGRKPPPNDPL